MFAYANGRVRHAAREIAHSVRGRVFALLTGERLLRNREKLMISKMAIYKKKPIPDKMNFSRAARRISRAESTLSRAAGAFSRSLSLRDKLQFFRNSYFKK